MRRPYVHWTADEWRFFALALHESNPKAGLLYSPALSMLTQPMIDSALKLMPPERQRKIKNVHNVRSMLLQIYTKAIADADRLFFPNGIASPSSTAAPATPVEKKRGHHTGPLRRVVWSKEEWVAVAAEIHRLNPHKNYPENPSLNSISKGDIKFAQQRVLPEDRRRNGILPGGDPKTYERLRPAFDTLREMLKMRAQEDARAMMLAQADTAPVAAAPTPAPAPQPQAAPSSAAGNPWEAAFKPMMGLLAGALLDQAAERLQAGTLQPVLLPLLTQALQQAFPAGLPAAAAPAPSPKPAPAPTPAAHSKPVTPPAPAFVPPVAPFVPTAKASAALATAANALAALEQSVPSPAPAPTPAPVPVTQQPVHHHKPAFTTAPQEDLPHHVMKVGIWGGQGVTWLDDLRRSFPTLDIEYADTSKKIGRLQRCDKVILMTNLVPSPARQLAKKHLGGRLVYINGTQAEVRGLLTTYAATPKKYKP